MYIVYQIYYLHPCFKNAEKKIYKIYLLTMFQKQAEENKLVNMFFL